MAKDNLDMVKLQALRCLDDARYGDPTRKRKRRNNGVYYAAGIIVVVMMVIFREPLAHWMGTVILSLR